MKIHTEPVLVAPAINEALASSERILLLSHVNPDGDAIGSMLGVWHVLRALGKTVLPLASSALPAFVSDLPGIEHVQVYERGEALPPADLIWLVDTANLARVGPIYEEQAAALATLPLIIVDHHATNEGEGQINLIDAEAASCAELVYMLLHAMHVPVPPAAATCLLMGITTDTQSFQTSSTRPQTLHIAADLVEAGGNLGAIVQKIYYETPYTTVHLLGQSLNTIAREDGLIWTHISQAMMQQTGADDGAYDDVIMALQRIDGARICVLFKERADGKVKISLRSRPGIDVSAIAQRWGGGGHKQAAGATLDMGLEAARAEVLPVLRAQLKV